MDKKEKSIKLHLDKAIGYSGKAHDESQIALDDSPIRDCRISEVYHMTGEQIREYFNL